MAGLTSSCGSASALVWKTSNRRSLPACGARQSDPETVLHQLEHPLDLVGRGLVEVGHLRGRLFSIRSPYWTIRASAASRRQEASLRRVTDRLFAALRLDFHFFPGSPIGAGLDSTPLRPLHALGICGRFVPLRVAVSSSEAIVAESTDARNRAGAVETPVRGEPACCA